MSLLPGYITDVATKQIDTELIENESFINDLDLIQSTLYKLNRAEHELHKKVILAKLVMQARIRQIEEMK